MGKIFLKFICSPTENFNEGETYEFGLDVDGRTLASAALWLSRGDAEEVEAPKVEEVVEVEVKAKAPTKSKVDKVKDRVENIL